MKIALLAHDLFPDRAKTALGIIRYRDYAEVEVVGVLDRGNHGRTVDELLPDVEEPIPVVESCSDLPEFDALVIGVAPIGGGFDESWRPDVEETLRRGNAVVSGLHTYLADLDGLSSIAEEYGAELVDVRKSRDVDVAEGIEADTQVTLTVGTDCSVGKMTTSMALVRDARKRGIDVGFVATGQTGVMLESMRHGQYDGYGVPVDAVMSDYIAGAVEDAVLSSAEEGYDHLIVEGQGSIYHPAYSGVTLGLLHGSRPDNLVLCHSHGRDEIRGYGTRIPSLEQYVDVYQELAEPVSGATVEAGALDTSSFEDGSDAHRELEQYGEVIDCPTFDPVRFGVEDAADVLFD
ncbi:MAG: DUF1611 domain-containing protein [Halobacteria archaeon]